MTRKERFSFLSIADLQFANVPDGKSFKGKTRYYKNALRQIDAMMKHYKGEKFDFTVHFGDLVDLHCKKPRTDIPEICKKLKDLNFGKVYHMIGNHDLYQVGKEGLTREDILQYLEIAQEKDQKAYYSIDIENFRIIVLDTFDISILGWPSSHPHYKLANEIMEKHHPNGDNVNSPERLKDRKRRFVAFNGGISDTQLAWIKEQMLESQKLGLKVIFFTHVPLVRADPKSSAWLWNDKESLNLIEQFSNVVAVISGHAHDGGYEFRNGIHHIVLQGAIESFEDCFGKIEVYDDQLLVNGVGTFQSYTCTFREACK